MKVAIVAFNNLRISPYVRTYSGWLTKKGIEFDVIYLDRDSEKEELGSKSYPISYNKKRHKLINFLRFARKTKKIIKKNKYDFLFVMPTFPAVLLSGFLKRKYKGRYLVDIRDYTHEKNKFFYSREKKALENSAMNVISALGFKNFLPECEYIFCPNISDAYRKENHSFSRGAEPIRIAYVGTIAYAENCKKLIDLVLKDDRFRFDFYGGEIGSMPVTSYIKEISSDRIVAHGTYTANEKADIVKRSHILFNVYGNGSTLVRYALSNKLYDGMCFKKPILVSSDTDMQKESADFGFAIDFGDKDILSKLYDWYLSIDKQSFDNYGDEYIRKTYSELDEFYSLLEERVGKACEVKK